MFFSFYSIFCLGSTKNEGHICNLPVKTKLLMHDKGGNQQIFFYLQRGDGGQSGSRDLMKRVDLSKKLIFPVSATQNKQLSGVFFFQFNFDANLAHPTVTITSNKQTDENWTNISSMISFKFKICPKAIHMVKIDQKF